MNDNNHKILSDDIKIIEENLKRFNHKPGNGMLQGSIIDTMNYSLEAGGKRIRPVLVLEFCRACGGNVNDALSTACALEMIHTFSLIHDDLPAMDNDDYRRGRPSCHKQFNEAAAILAGDALSVKAFEIILRDDLIDNDRKVKILTEISSSVGVDGMIGGQVIDMENEQHEDIDEANLTKLCRLKTGALLKTACVCGCIAANADEYKIQMAEEFGYKLGLAFQIIDDILDVTSTQDVLGKPIGSDKEQNKTTFVSLLGIEKSQNKAAELTYEADKILNEIGECGFLHELTALLLEREK